MFPLLGQVLLSLPLKILRVVLILYTAYFNDLKLLSKIAFKSNQRSLWSFWCCPDLPRGLGWR